MNQNSDLLEKMTESRSFFRSVAERVVSGVIVVALVAGVLYFTEIVVPVNLLSAVPLKI
jgi:hypothetical protein